MRGRGRKVLQEGLLPGRGRLRGVGPGTSTPVQLTPWCAADGPDMGKYWGLELALSKNTEVGYYLLFTASAVSGGRGEVVSRAVGRRWFLPQLRGDNTTCCTTARRPRWPAGEARRELALGSWAVAKTERVFQSILLYVIHGSNSSFLLKIASEG